MKDSILSLFPYLGEKTVARRLDQMFDRKTVIGALFGAGVGGLTTTLISLMTPGMYTASMAWAALLLSIPIVSVYWRFLQRKWEEKTQ